jgi:RHS repeat-associated protein
VIPRLGGRARTFGAAFLLAAAGILAPEPATASLPDLDQLRADQQLAAAVPPEQPLPSASRQDSPFDRLPKTRVRGLELRLTCALGGADGLSCGTPRAYGLWYDERASDRFVYANARFYDPEVGRFTSQDSYLGQIDDPPSLHRYFYANDNPTRYVDPTGHCVMTTCSPMEDMRRNASPELRAEIEKAEQLQGEAFMGAMVGVGELGAKTVWGLAKTAWNIEGLLRWGVTKTLFGVDDEWTKGYEPRARRVSDAVMAVPQFFRETAPGDAPSALLGGVYAKLDAAKAAYERGDVFTSARYFAGAAGEVYLWTGTVGARNTTMSPSQQLAYANPTSRVGAGAVVTIGRPGSAGFLMATNSSESGSGAPASNGGSPQAAPDAPSSGPGSAAHKAAAWQAYLNSPRAQHWSYERWSATYGPNMNRATAARRAADAYHKRLGWGTREATVYVEGVPRRLDIADVARQRAIEHKTGRQSASQDVLWEIQRDQILMEQGWDISWFFEGTATKPLRDALDAAGIRHNLK